MEFFSRIIACYHQQNKTAEMANIAGKAWTTNIDREAVKLPYIPATNTQHRKNSAIFLDHT